MPELPEVETVRRGLAPIMEGATVERLELRRPDLRFPFPDQFAEFLEGQQVVSVGRRAKYLLVDMANGQVIIMHLGMSGSFRIEEDAIGNKTPGVFHHEKTRLAAHDHVTFHLRQQSGQTARVIYNDPRRFGFMLMCKRSELVDHPTFRNMGVEPVGNALTPDVLAQALLKKGTPLKSALLDQSVIAGLGNIYVCEALWRSKLSPKRKAGTLVKASGKPTDRLVTLEKHIRDVIADAIKAGGSSLRDHAQTDGSLGYFQHSFAAYDREGKPCRHEGCGKSISRIVQSGRSTFYCSSCQR